MNSRKKSGRQIFRKRADFSGRTSTGSTDVGAEECMLLYFFHCFSPGEQKKSVVCSCCRKEENKHYFALFSPLLCLVLYLVVCIE